MKIKNILLTNDDGYQSTGLKVLIDVLKDDYQLKVCTVKNQQTGVGGSLNIEKVIKWDKTKISGIETLYVNSTPASAMEFVSSYFKQNFDLVISGINLGHNLGPVMFSSGTFAAAYWAVSIPIAKRGIVFGLEEPRSSWYIGKYHHEKYQKLLAYPGQYIKSILDLVVNNNFWTSEIININFPTKRTNELVLTRPMRYLNWLYRYPSCDIDYDKQQYSFIDDFYDFHDKKDNYDYLIIQKGQISLTPIKKDMFDERAFNKVKTKKFCLKDSLQ